jgi:hypothetical protein
LNSNKREKAEFFYDDNGCWLPLIFDNRHRLSFQSSSVFYFFFWCTTEFPSLCNLVIQCAVKKRVVTTLTSTDALTLPLTFKIISNYVPFSECVLI